MTSTLLASPVGTELLDDPGADPATVARTLHHIARANWWFGGAAALGFALARLLDGVPHDRPLTLLDLGTGDGDLPRRAERWARRRGRRLRALGLERSPVAARLARRAGLATVLADVGTLPIADHSVDIVLLNLFLHHFAPASAARLLAEADRLARVGVIVSDLERSRVSGPLFRVGGRLLGFDTVTIEDGVTSIARGYTPAALAALLAAAGVRGTVHRRPGWRVVALWRTAA